MLEVEIFGKRQGRRGAFGGRFLAIVIRMFGEAHTENTEARKPALGIP